VTREFLRIFSGILVALVATVGLTMHVALEVHQDRFERELPDRLKGIGALVRERLDVEGPEALQQSLASLRRLLAHDTALLPLARAAEDLQPAAAAQLRQGSSVGRFFPREGPKIYVPLTDGEHAVVIGPFAPPAGSDPWLLALLVGLSVIVVGLAALALSLPLVRRLRRLEQATTRFGEGELDARAPAVGHDAVSHVGRRFNRMAERIQALLVSKQELMQAVSHELRTPISRLRFRLEAISSLDEAADRAEHAVGVERDLDELERLVEELLEYARLDVDALLHVEPLDVDAALDPLLAEQEELHPDLPIALEVEAGAEGLCADPRGLERALGNLVRNAARHARTQVTIRVSRGAEGTVVAVLDDGPGVPEDQRERVLEPFSRLDGSRSRSTGGAGLGLAIARRIVDAHGGTLRVTDAPGGGACFETSWPDTGRDIP